MNAPGTDDDLEGEAVQLIRHALAVVRQYRLAEVEVTLSSDRSGVIHVRHVARLPLAALVDKPCPPRGGLDTGSTLSVP